MSETNKMLEQRLEKHEARNHQIFALESEILRLQTDLDNEKVTIILIFLQTLFALLSKKSSHFLILFRVREKNLPCQK